MKTIRFAKDASKSSTNKATVKRKQDPFERTRDCIKLLCSGTEPASQFIMPNDGQMQRLRLQSLVDNDDHQISNVDFERFRSGETIPVEYNISDGIHSWDFAIRGPYGFLYLFREDANRGIYFVRKTTLLSEQESGVPIVDQIISPAICSSKVYNAFDREAATYIPAWRNLIRKTPERKDIAFGTARDPDFQVTYSDEDFARYLDSHSVLPGHGLIRHSLCFVPIDPEYNQFRVLEKDRVVGVVTNSPSSERMSSSYLLLAKGRSACMETNPRVR